MAFWGHVVSKDGKQAGPKKMETLMEWPRPTTVKEVRSFMGLTSYYMRFVKDFSKITTPLTRLIQKNIKFSRTDRCEEHFPLLKGLLTLTPVLTLPSED